VAAGWKSNVQRAVTPTGYPTMSLDDIRALDVGGLADKDARIFMWATQRYLPDAFDILAAWGFRYKQTFVWHKLPPVSPFGGSLAPNNAEFALVGVKGSPPVLSRAKSCILATPGNAGRRKDNGAGPNKHSRKPDAFLDMVEQVSPGPYVELFARRARFGWDYWGNESLGTAELGEVA
jgi:N6-adenosine-specific RNA methylase IME4